jgi:ABC-type bacteriocin/lantibiotic exporter with double-glycine peptidase domain
MAMVKIDFPSGRQTFEFDCGPKALQLVMAYYGVDVREDALIAKLGANNSSGTQPGSMIEVAHSYGFEVVTHTNCPMKVLLRYLDNQTPVIVLVQAWVDRYMSLFDWRQTNEYGHYVIVIGYEKGVILFEDPATISHTWLTDREFIARWHDVDPTTKELLPRFAMVLGGRPPKPRKPEPMS